MFDPDLIIMDARKCFITKGPSKGDVREPNIILASDSRIAIDKEEVDIIRSFSGNDLAKISPDDIVQLKSAQKLGIK